MTIIGLYREKRDTALPLPLILLHTASQLTEGGSCTCLAERYIWFFWDISGCEKHSLSWPETERASPITHWYNVLLELQLGRYVLSSQVETVPDLIRWLFNRFISASPPVLKTVVFGFRYFLNGKVWKTDFLYKLLYVQQSFYMSSSPFVRSR